jgi:hypothetical protein
MRDHCVVASRVVVFNGQRLDVVMGDGLVVSDGLLRGDRLRLRRGFCIRNRRFVCERVLLAGAHLCCHGLDGHWRGDRRRLDGHCDGRHGDCGCGARWRPSRWKKFLGDLIVVGHAPAADFGPEIIAAACRNDGEVFAWELGRGRKLVLDRPELVKRSLQLRRQELTDDPVDGLERQAPARQLDLARGRDDVRFLAGVHHQRFAVNLENRLQQRWNQAHLFT